MNIVILNAFNITVIIFKKNSSKMFETLSYKMILIIIKDRYECIFFFTSIKDSIAMV